MDETISDNSILIVDDNELNIEILEELLKQTGYKVRSAKSGKEALQSVKEKLPLLILLDIVMPGMDGYEVFEKLRSEKRTGHIPIIFVSALNDENAKAKGMILSGSNNYITKPYNFAEVLLKIKTMVAINDEKLV